VARVIRERSWHRAAHVAVGGSALAVWFLVGPLAEQGGTDYILRIPKLNRTVELALGLVAAGIALVSVAMVWRRRDLLVRAGWWRVYGRCSLAGIVIALSARIVSAASAGANVGGGIVMFGYPLPLAYSLEHAVREARAIRGGGYADPWGLWWLDWPLLGTLAVVAALMATG
jgi:hypothetical protein